MPGAKDLRVADPILKSQIPAWLTPSQPANVYGLFLEGNSRVLTSTGGRELAASKASAWA